MSVHLLRIIWSYLMVAYVIYNMTADIEFQDRSHPSIYIYIYIWRNVGGNETDFARRWEY